MMDQSEPCSVHTVLSDYVRQMFTQYIIYKNPGSVKSLLHNTNNKPESFFLARNKGNGVSADRETVEFLILYNKSMNVALLAHPISPPFLAPAINAIFKLLHSHIFCECQLGYHCTTLVLKLMKLKFKK